MFDDSANDGLIVLLCLYPIGLVRAYLFLRSDAGKARPLPWKVASFALPTLIAAGILLYLCKGPKAPPGSAVLSPSFFGTWRNVNPEFHNWWTVNSAGVINYFVDETGKCIAKTAIVIDRDHVNIPFGNARVVHVRSGELGTMIFQTPRGGATHERVPPYTICMKQDGTYFEGAPYPRAGKHESGR